MINGVLGPGDVHRLGRCCGCLFRPRVEGLDHVPAEGAAIVAGNHLSFADPLLIPRY